MASEGKSYLPRRGEPKRNSWEWGWGESHAPSFAVDNNDTQRGTAPAGTPSAPHSPQEVGAIRHYLPI